MSRMVLCLVAGIAFASAAAKAPKPEAKELPPVIAHAGDICKATGGFGRVFSRGYGKVDTTADDDWAPFEKLSIAAGTIRAEASFQGAGDSEADDVAKAEKFFHALDKAVTAKGHFKHHETSGNAARFSAGKEKGAGVVLELHQEADTIVAVCNGG